MRASDIMEALVMAVEETIQKQWRHDVVIEGWSSAHINVEIDGKEYVLVLNEVPDGSSFCEFLPGGC